MNKESIKRMSHLIERLNSKPLMLVLLLAAVGFFWLFNFSALPFSNPELTKLSGGEGLLDLMLYYSAEEAFTALNHYGVAGRELYVRFLAVDFIFIGVYSLGFALLMTRTVRAVCSESSTWRWLNMLPLGIGLFDSMENLSILGMLALYPDASVGLGTLSGVFTLCKHLLTLTALLALGYGGLVLLLRKLGFKLCAGCQH
ncbi:MAG TPA: hypothetical protein ENJ04_10145 [Nitrospirae bacterium]|nr:hypothetical protein [Nitrospirota bacterium]